MKALKYFEKILSSEIIDKASEVIMENLPGLSIIDIESYLEIIIKQKTNNKEIPKLIEELMKRNKNDFTSNTLCTLARLRIQNHGAPIKSIDHILNKFQMLFINDIEHLGISKMLYIVACFLKFNIPFNTNLKNIIFSNIMIKINR